MSFRRWDIDGWSAAMAAAIALVLAVAAWQRFGPARAEVPAIGSVPPLLRLRDPADSEPQIWFPPRDRVVWLAFWSAAGAGSRAELAALEGAWKRLETRPRFAMLAVAIDAERPDAVRSALAGARTPMPIAVATPEARRAFGIDANPSAGPLHFLIGPDGRIFSESRGADPKRIDRLVGQAELVLDALEPAARLDRFAAATGPGSATDPEAVR